MKCREPNLTSFSIDKNYNTYTHTYTKTSTYDTYIYNKVIFLVIILIVSIDL